MRPSQLGRSHASFCGPDHDIMAIYSAMVIGVDGALILVSDDDRGPVL
jgi:hypothetical protein